MRSLCCVIRPSLWPFLIGNGCAADDALPGADKGQKSGNGRGQAPPLSTRALHGLMNMASLSTNTAPRLSPSHGSWPCHRPGPLARRTALANVGVSTTPSAPGDSDQHDPMMNCGVQQPGSPQNYWKGKERQPRIPPAHIDVSLCSTCSTSHTSRRRFNASNGDLPCVLTRLHSELPPSHPGAWDKCRSWEEGSRPRGDLLPEEPS